jgi:hypothetical protein
MKNKRLLPLIFFVLWAGLINAQQPLNILFRDAEGCLRYTADGNNNYLPDFSQAGYKNGNTPLPDVTVVKTIGPIPGDNTTHIQQALDEVGSLPPNEDGIRGALLLEAGLYEIYGTIHIRESGVILRGSGQGASPAENTLLSGPGNTPAERDIIRIGDAPGVNWTAEIPGTRSVITSPFVPAGSRSLQVAAPELYSEGDVVIIYQPSTANWLGSINFGDTAGDAPWSPGDIDIFYKRTITSVDFSENKVILDVPVYDHLERSLAQAEIYVLDEPDIKKQCGVENLRVTIATAGPMDEAHARNAIHLIGVEDCWVREVTAMHFTYAAVETEIADRITVLNCNGLEPHSLIEGARRYNFVSSAKSNNILFEGCHTTQGRHAYVSNGTSSVSNVVFYNCTSAQDYNACEGHRRWSQGLLYDNLTFSSPETSNLLGLYNRGSFGTGHGWAAVNSVAWNVAMPGGNRLLLQRPPGRQNYAVGCQAIVSANHQFNHPKGYEEGTDENLLIPSLYEAQLEQRVQMGIAPDAPARLEAAFIGNAVELSWMDIAASETGYVVEASLDDGENYVVIGELPADATGFLDTNTENFGGLISYRVFAIGNACPSPYSNVAKAATMTTHTEEIASIPDLRVVPNPAKDTVWIDGEHNQHSSVWIYNSNGKLLKQQPASRAINCAAWPVGLYLFKVKNAAGQQQIIKFIKS